MQWMTYAAIAVDITGGGGLIIWGGNRPNDEQLLLRELTA